MLKPALLVVPLLLLAGCAAPAPDDGLIHVVASTSVYGDLAQQIGGSGVEVTSIIDDPAQDPHQFEANGRVQLALSRADVVIVNGGGYDDFATTMLDASGNDGARIIDAVELSGYDTGADDFNEHVWYDYPTMQTVVMAIAAALDIADPAHATAYDGRADGLVAQLDALIQFEGSIAAAAGGAGVIITEPVPLYALEAAGLRNLTPPEFSEAIEQDIDVPATLLQSVLNRIGDGSAAVVVYNAQTGGPQTDAILDVASDNSVPAIGLTEILPDDVGYVDWQSGFLQELLRALT
ncbi:MAG: zinc ABC transporter substrate-binding protein [Pseudolysinimonas sp.]